uniref:Uncharacterized protein n=1 Tax=Accipiter nisus TaxID=211598 RepID=A0A8B9MN97_9AVES
VGRTWGLPAATSDLQLLERGALLAEAVLGAVGGGRAGAGATRGARPRRGRHELLDGAGGGPRVPAAAHPVDGGRGAAAQRRLHLPQPAQRLQQRRRAPHAPRHGAVPASHLPPAAPAAPPPPSDRHRPRRRPPPRSGRHDTGNGAERRRWHRPGAPPLP